MPPVANKPQIIAAARRAAALSQQASTASDALLNALSNAVKRPVETDAKAAHRREHRMGVPSKLAIDSEVQAFVESRLDTHTFGDIAKEVAENFPPERHVSRSSIHRWWLKLRQV